jgi:hypothetical protein
VGAGAFSAGWIFSPSSSAVVALALVSGMTAALGQITTRDLLARSQALVDRGIDDFYNDGGEKLAQARANRNRIERLSWSPIIFGVLGSTFAALRTIYAHPLWTGSALACAGIALVVSAMLFALNRILGAHLEAQRLTGIQEKRVRDVMAARKAFDPKQVQDDPNIMGYKYAGTCQEKPKSEALP